jgi:hypothetical protein
MFFVCKLKQKNVHKNFNKLCIIASLHSGDSIGRTSFGWSARIGWYPNRNGATRPQTRRIPMPVIAVRRFGCQPMPGPTGLVVAGTFIPGSKFVMRIYTDYNTVFWSCWGVLCQNVVYFRTILKRRAEYRARMVERKVLDFRLKK